MINSKDNHPATSGVFLWKDKNIMGNISEIRNYRGISPDADCSLSRYVAKLRPPYNRAKDDDPFKVERGKLVGRILASYVPQAWTEINQDPIYHVITIESEPSEKIDDFFNVKAQIFYKLMYETLNNSMKKEIRRRAGLPYDHQERKELMRLQSIPPFAAFGLGSLPQVEDSFTHGNGTAVETPAKLIRVIPCVYSNQYSTEPSKSQTLKIARNSFSTANEMMLMHVDDHSVLTKGLKDKESKMFDPTHFVIEDGVLKTRKDSVQTIFSNTKLYPHSSVKTGCPARFQRIHSDDGDQMLARDFFDRFLNVVEKL